MALEQGAHPLHLVVGQGVHGVDDDGPDAGAQLPLLLLPEQVLQNGQQEAFGLARAGAGGHHQILPCRGQSQGLLLVAVQGPIQLQFPVLFGHGLQGAEQGAGLALLH